MSTPQHGLYGRPPRTNERRYGPFQGAGGSERVLFEGALRDLPLAQLQRMAERARAYEVAQKQKRNGREKHL